MGPLHHRAPGLLGAALTDDRVAVSIITDLVHVHPAAVTLAFLAKGADRVALVTDAVAWEGDPDGDAPRLPDGTLMGSVLTADAAVRNAVRACGIPLADAVRAASTTPANVLGLRDRGRIEVGARADLVALHTDLTVQQTWVAGRSEG
jgi:N-acetylglucosamine-6-phosphate deacetylase